MKHNVKVHSVNVLKRGHQRRGVNLHCQGERYVSEGTILISNRRPGISKTVSVRNRAGSGVERILHVVRKDMRISESVVTMWDGVQLCIHSNYSDITVTSLHISESMVINKVKQLIKIVNNHKKSVGCWSLHKKVSFNVLCKEDNLKVLYNEPSDGIIEYMSPRECYARLINYVNENNIPVPYTWLERLVSVFNSVCYKPYK